MTKNEVRGQIIQIIRESLPGVELGELNDDSLVNADQGIDSMGFTLIVCRIEAKFDIRIPDKQWSKLQSLGDVVDAVMKRL